MSVEERLERLERQNKWMRRLGAVGVAVAAAVFLIGQGKEEELPDLVARSLTLKDEDGNTRLEARTDRMEFSTKGGTVLLSLVAGSGDKPLTFVRVGDETKAQILLSAWHGAETKTAESMLILRDAKGKVIWQAPKE